VALAREPHAGVSAAVLRWAESGGSASVAWHSLTNCVYLLKGGARPSLKRLLRLVEGVPVATADGRRALELPMADAQDAFQRLLHVIVTRNVSDYRCSPVLALSPKAFLMRAAT
jgi:hypothetical protein